MVARGHTPVCDVFRCEDSGWSTLLQFWLQLLVLITRYPVHYEMLQLIFTP